MMTTIPLDVAQATLNTLIHGLTPGRQIIITENTEPVAMLVAIEKPRRELGSQRGSVLYMAPDFDDSLEQTVESIH
jgi:antitoxin (DNA-binding transcriptional repressor) of toxin-antitoxin stability system